MEIEVTGSNPVGGFEEKNMNIFENLEKTLERSAESHEILDQVFILWKEMSPHLKERYLCLNQTEQVLKQELPVYKRLTATLFQLEECRIKMMDLKKENEDLKKQIAAQPKNGT